MKKILYSVFALAIAAFTFTSCEDVPAPYDIPGDDSTDQPVVIEPAGDGTLENPYNVARILEITGALAEGETSEDEMYITGIITDISEYYGTQYGNATYTISDDEDGTNKFTVFQSYYFNNERYKEGQQNIKIGDVVVVYGKVQNFVYESGGDNTLETAARQSYLVSLNGQTGEGGGGEDPTPSFEPEGDGTEANPFNSVAAYQYVSSLEADVPSENEIYIKGIVSQISANYNSSYKTANYYISVDGTFDSKDSGNQFYVYGSNYLNNEKYTSGDLLSVGDEVVVCGKVVNFKGNTPETQVNQSYLYSWTKGEGGPEDVGDPNALNGDFECWIGGLPNNWQSASTASSATLTQSTDAHSGDYSVLVGGVSDRNQRISYKELELQPGDYTMTFYVKAATSKGASVRPGYVKVVNGKVDGSYQYGSYTNDISNTEWVQVTHEFTIPELGTYCVLVMNSGNPGGDLLFDDFTLTMGSTVIIE